MIPTPLRPRARSRSMGVVAPMAAVVAVGLVLAGCGDGGDDGDPAGGAVVDEAVTDGPSADRPVADQPMTVRTSQDAAADEPAAEGGSIAGVDALIAGLTPLEYDPATVSTATVDGGTFAATDVTGPVVYWFWAPWCTVCRSEAPEVAEVAAEFDGRVTFVGVAGLGPVDDMQDFVSDTGVGGFDHAVDPDGSVWTSFGVFSQPSYVFVDSSGEARTLVGGLGGDTLRVVADTLAG